MIKEEKINQGVVNMAIFKVTATNGQTAIVNGNDVNKVIDFSTYRVIYFGSDSNVYQVKDTLDAIFQDMRQPS